MVMRFVPIFVFLYEFYPHPATSFSSAKSDERLVRNDISLNKALYSQEQPQHQANQRPDTPRKLYGY